MTETTKYTNIKLNIIKYYRKISSTVVIKKKPWHVFRQVVNIVGFLVLYDFNDNQNVD